MIWLVRTRFPSDIIDSFSTEQEAQARATELNDEFQTANYIVRKLEE